MNEVWEVWPHPGSRKFDYYIEKDFSRMVAYVNDTLDTFLDRFSEIELRQGVTLTFKLVTMANQEYSDLIGE